MNRPKIIERKISNRTTKNNTDKLSIDFCKSILNNVQITLTDAEVENVRDFLYALAKIEYQIFQHEINKYSSSIKSIANESESNHLYPSEYRRAG